MTFGERMNMDCWYLAKHKFTVRTNGGSVHVTVSGTYNTAGILKVKEVACQPAPAVPLLHGVRRTDPLSDVHSCLV